MTCEQSKVQEVIMLLYQNAILFKSSHRFLLVKKRIRKALQEAGGTESRRMLFFKRYKMLNLNV